MTSLQFFRNGLAGLCLVFLLGLGAPVLPVAAADPTLVQGAIGAATEGDLLQVNGDDKIFLIQGGQRHWIADTQALQRLSPDFGRLRRVDFEELRTIPSGRPMRSGPLIRAAATGRVYLLTQETNWPAPRRHWVNDIDSFTALGFAWEDVATDWPVPASRYANAPALTFAPVLRTATPIQTAFGTFTGIPAWKLQTQDERLIAGLSLAYQYNPDWRNAVGDKLAATGATIDWGTLPADVGGLYSANRNSIIVNSSLQSESLGVIATVLAHEGLHAVATRPDVVGALTEAQSNALVQACYTEEAQAFAYEAATWSLIPAQYRSTTRIGRIESALSTLYQQKGLAGLQALVSSDPDYQQECTANASPARHDPFRSDLI